jgi:hypothetical protein
MGFKLTSGQLKIISSVLSNLAAAWLGSIIVLPGVFRITSTTELLVLLTYSLFFATLSMLAASKIEDKLL